MYGARRGRERDRSGLIGGGAIWGLLGVGLAIADLSPAFQQLGYFILIVGGGVALVGVALAIHDHVGSRRRRG